MQAIPIPGRTDIMTVVGHWSTEKGTCYDCGLPAAFAVPDAYGKGKPLGPEHHRCAVCAANDAVDGERIVSLFAENQED